MEFTYLSLKAGYNLTIKKARKTELGYFFSLRWQYTVSEKYLMQLNKQLLPTQTNQTNLLGWRVQKNKMSSAEHTLRFKTNQLTLKPNSKGA